MRIGVWNLECVNFKDRNAARLDFLLKHDADIWVLTETHEEIDLSPTHSLAARSKPRTRTANGMHWVSIWSRFEVIEPIDSSDVRTAIALLNTPAGRMLLFGTVWPWGSDTGEYPGDQAWTYWARQAPVIAQQGKQWKKLQADWPDSILCVAGDLNMTFGGPGSYYSREGRLEAALAMQAHDLVCTTAWARLPERAPIDHIPLPPDIDHVLLPYDIALRTHVRKTWPGRPRDPDRLSDHSGLIIEITSHASSASKSKSELARSISASDATPQASISVPTPSVALVPDVSALLPDPATVLELAEHNQGEPRLLPQPVTDPTAAPPEPEVHTQAGAVVEAAADEVGVATADPLEPFSEEPKPPAA